MMRLCPIKYGGFVSEPTPSYTVVSLLHFDDDFTCEAGLIYTIDGTPTIDTAQSRFGVASMNRNIWASGPGNYPYTFVDLPIIATTYFTFEFWFYGLSFYGAFPDYNTIFQLYNGDPSASGGAFRIYVDGITGNLSFNFGAGNGTVNCSSPQWYHIALSSDGTTTWAYVDGVLSATEAGVYLPAGTGWCIGGAKNNGGDLQTGYYDEFRALIGSDPSNCAYPDGTTFTPPSAPFTL